MGRLLVLQVGRMPAWSCGTVCIDGSWVASPMGIVAEVVELLCQRRPRSPLWACSAASTPAALLVAFLPLAAVLRRRQSATACVRPEGERTVW